MSCPGIVNPGGLNFTRRPSGGLRIPSVCPTLLAMVRVIHEQGVTVVLTGSSYTGLQLEALEELGQVLLAEADEATPPRFVIDMSETTFISSSFIETLVRAWKRIKNRHGTMALCGVQPLCREVLRVAHLDTIWPIYGTRSEAVASV